jgi:glycerol uptake facilitator-like aquaporin
MPDMRRRLAAEAIGACLLAAAVVGSGIMGERLAAGNDAIALLANTAATVAALAVLIGLFGPVSGAHFNPAVTLAATLRSAMSPRLAVAYVLVQIAGCIAGALLAHAMFDLPLLQASTHARTGPGQWLSELIATAGLVAIVATCRSVEQAALRVPLWIGAAYWFTASTSFANPAITIGRAFTDTFAGIRPADAPAFLAAQFIGVGAGIALAAMLRNPVGKDSTA